MTVRKRPDMRCSAIYYVYSCIVKFLINAWTSATTAVFYRYIIYIKLYLFNHQVPMRKWINITLLLLQLTFVNFVHIHCQASILFEKCIPLIKLIEIKMKKYLLLTFCNNPNHCPIYNVSYYCFTICLILFIYYISLYQVPAISPILFPH